MSGKFKSVFPPATVTDTAGLPALTTGDEWVAVGDVVVPKSALRKDANRSDGYAIDLTGRYIVDDLSNARTRSTGAGDPNFFGGVESASSAGKQIGEIEFNPSKHIIKDGKVYTVTAGGLKQKEMEGVAAVSLKSNPPTIVIDLNYKSKADKDTSDGIDTNNGDVITKEDAPEALKPNTDENFADWETRMQKYGSYALYLGLGILTITTIASFIEWLKGDTDAVNAEVFKIKEIKREGKITYTSQYQICAGDRVYNFGGFANVNKSDMDSYPGYVTTGGAGNLDDSSQTFTALDAGVSYKPPDGKELTFRVETNHLRRLSCTLANIARDVAAGAASVTQEVTKGFFEGLGIDFAWVIGGFIALVIVGIVLTVLFKK